MHAVNPILATLRMKAKSAPGVRQTTAEQDGEG
jgi:hypothetical protein